MRLLSSPQRYLIIRTSPQGRRVEGSQRSIFFSASDCFGMVKVDRLGFENPIRIEL
jgi:hypothetical protein